MRRSVHWGCHYATTLDIEVDPLFCFGTFPRFIRNTVPGVFVFSRPRGIKGQRD